MFNSNKWFIVKAYVSYLCEAVWSLNCLSPGTTEHLRTHLKHLILSLHPHHMLTETLQPSPCITENNRHACRKIQYVVLFGKLSQ